MEHGQVDIQKEKHEHYLELIRAAGNSYLSESEACMVALAHCNPALLPAGMTSQKAWKRIDHKQLKAINVWSGKRIFD